MLPPSPDKDGTSAAVGIVAPSRPVMLPPSTGEDGISTAVAAVGTSMMLPPSPDKDDISSAVAPVAPCCRTLKKAVAPPQQQSRPGDAAAIH